MSQSPQIGSMFLTRKRIKFLQSCSFGSQSPQIGSMFLTFLENIAKMKTFETEVAIPSNRVNVSYFPNLKTATGSTWLKWGRNPLKSGQCFLLCEVCAEKYCAHGGSQSPQIGSMFLTPPNALQNCRLK